MLVLQLPFFGQLLVQILFKGAKYAPRFRRALFTEAIAFCHVPAYRLDVDEEWFGKSWCGEEPVADNHPPESAMLSFLPPFLKVAFGLLLLAVNTVLHCSVLFLVAAVKFLVPISSVRVLLSRALILVAESWISVNGFTFWLFTKIKWQIEGVEDLRYEGHYLVLSNHQSWVDIPVLQRTFNKRLPFLKFFLKKELIWVPFLGLAWWALDFPFMKRHSKEFLEKHPERKGSDLATTRKACERFRQVTMSVMNFVEGTRFTDSKHDRQESPYTHLLKPKAGGVAFVLNAMGDILKTVIDVTIVYPGGRPDFLDILSGRLREVRVFVRQLPIPEDLRGGDYENDPEYRVRIQAWIKALWVEKDAMISRLLVGDQLGCQTAYAVEECESWRGDSSS